MSFWTQTDPTQIKDPKRGLRFALYFNGITCDAAPGGYAWWAKSVNKPSFTLSTQEHKYLNHTFHYPGSVTWNEVSATLVDPVDPDMTATFSQILEGSGYQVPATASDLTTISKSQAASALGQVTIVQLDAEGNALETWTLHNAFITTVDYGALSYDDDSLTQVTVGMRYDWASVETANAASTAAGGKSFFNVGG